LAAWKKAFLIQVGHEGNDDFPMIILCNKVDLENREVTKKEVEQFCNKDGISFYETSAKESKNF
jgi:GTPase SAR1 family protein